jgi:hypothetical protein
MIAYHYKNGNNPEKAFEYLTRAGEKAIDLHSTDLARSYFEEALTLAANLPVTESVRNRQQELRARLEEIPV